VAIVGYGPVGAVFANLLARYGLRIAVVERAADIYDKPRAITLDHEALRVF
jgi:3-(3-hydroxy-phenyl)propionate hydroxylase